ncbi:MAG: hypothetical protein PHY14_02435 [Candidatus Gracilibacteria bacterium]|nr:hypothetical protein [Candidatus Gracilibacteria bacterium]
MHLKSYFFILLIIFGSSSASTLLLLYYMSPEKDIQTALILMSISLLLASSSILSMLIFFVKKIYYRGDVTMSTMNASLRQAILITLGGFMMFTLYVLHLFEPKLIMIVWAAVGCLEVMAQAVE